MTLSSDIINNDDHLHSAASSVHRLRYGRTVFTETKISIASDRPIVHAIWRHWGCPRQTVSSSYEFMFTMSCWNWEMEFPIRSNWSWSTFSLVSALSAVHWSNTLMTIAWYSTFTHIGMGCRFSNASERTASVCCVHTKNCHFRMRMMQPNILQSANKIWTKKMEKQHFVIIFRKTIKTFYGSFRWASKMAAANPNEMTCKNVGPHSAWIGRACVLVFCAGLRAVCNSQFECEKQLNCESRMHTIYALLIARSFIMTIFHLDFTFRISACVGAKKSFSILSIHADAAIRINWILRNKMQSSVWVWSLVWFGWMRNSQYYDFVLK